MFVLVSTVAMVVVGWIFVLASSALVWDMVAEVGQAFECLSV